jgi:hypothetical protein
MKVQDVFTPNDIPTVTYVDRSEHKLEQKLRDFYQTPNLVISVSGPSKSGKTVLIKKVVDEDLLITVLGAGITSAENLWDRVLNWMGTPTEITTTKSSERGISGSGEGSGKIKVPLISEVEAKISAETSMSWGTETSTTRRIDGLSQVIREISKSEFCVFIDDFHYIREDIREEIGRQIKAAAENGVKIITASVPHRSDDVVRSNPELRGRVAAIDLDYWSVEELSQIASKGFIGLNINTEAKLINQLAGEALGSPQLMQAICLNLCYEINLKETINHVDDLFLNKFQIDDILLRTSSFTDFAKMVTSLHTGPRTRGTERKLHDFLDETGGDVYRAILLAIKKDPATLSFPYDNILSRVRAVTLGEAPVGSSINSALDQMNLIGEEVQPGTNPVSWDGDVFVITDPYFLFFIRNSDKLAALGRSPNTFNSI